MANDSEMNDLVERARYVDRLANQKLEFVQQHIGVDPFTMLALQQKLLMDWLIPEFNQDGSRSVDRLRFDIYCNEKVIETCDMMVRAAGQQLHIIQNNGKSSTPPDDADKPD